MRLQLSLEDSEASLIKLRDASAVELAHLQRSHAPDRKLIEQMQLKIELIKKCAVAHTGSLPVHDFPHPNLTNPLLFVAALGTKRSTD